MNTHTHTHKTESSTITWRLMRYHMTELPTKQHRELWASNREEKKKQTTPRAHLLHTTNRKKETHATQKQKGKDAPQERGPHKKRVSRERRRKTHQRRQGSEYRDLTWTLNCFFHTKNTRLLGIQQTKTSPLLLLLLLLLTLSLSSSSFVYIRIPPPKHREGKGFQQQI